ncbi:DUF4880 domain-containing protein [Acetobacter sp. TBRC 12305]|uniref:DUF4880 domain-containing protein n=1 Tax=Acetobacter garciniae TaxID=2817435 RepID=A0A939HQN5_9PROT|nr:DUF4880 domain-containing protein [Acetobacter garciniae]MBO1326684.1 DUF4880 domain-containing protein [Acetobacter garciniae]MBX0345021.1 DUF4880 domain-containing protein [Acetobacter garciniae]
MSDPGKTTRDEVASSWAMRLACGHLTANEQAVLDAWLATDFRNQGAMIRAQVVWQATERTAALAAGQPEAQTRAAVAQFHESRPARLTRRQVSWAAVASMTALLWPRQSHEMGRFYRTHDNMAENIALGNGRETGPGKGGGNSQLSLDCYSQARVYGTTIELLAGRCVTSSTAPTWIMTPYLRVTAQGRLQASLFERQASILLFSGSAQMLDPTNGQRLVLRPGEEVVASATSLTRRILSADDIAMQTSWMRGVVELQGQPLSEAVALFNRYNQRKIFVHGNAGARVVIGSFSLRDPDAFVSAVRSILHVDSVATPGRIDLY